MTTTREPQAPPEPPSQGWARLPMIPGPWETVVIVWRRLRKMSTALAMLFTLALSSIVATFIPQEPVTPQTVAAWRAGTEGPSATVAQILDGAELRIHPTGKAIARFVDWHDSNKREFVDSETRFKTVVEVHGHQVALNGTADRRGEVTVNLRSRLRRAPGGEVVEDLFEAFRRQVLVGIVPDQHHRRVDAGAEALDLLPGELTVRRDVKRIGVQRVMDMPVNIFGKACIDIGQNIAAVV